MARPEKSGLDYFPLDVGFLRDKKVKLLKTEFGASSVLFVLYVLSRVYEEEGYYLRWDKDECLLAVEEIGCGATASYIGEVLNRCLSRSLFDQRVFKMFGVLTSAGIQRRYLKGKEKRDEIEIIKEYFLLDVHDKKDVPAGILAKLALKSVLEEKTEVISEKTGVISSETTESKEKKSITTTTARTREETEIPDMEEVKRYFSDNHIDGDAEQFYLYNQSKNPSFKDWRLYASAWGKIEKHKNVRTSSTAGKTNQKIGFDLDEFFNAATLKTETGGEP